MKTVMFSVFEGPNRRLPYVDPHCVSLNATPFLQVLWKRLLPRGRSQHPPNLATFDFHRVAQWCLSCLSHLQPMNMNIMNFNEADGKHKWHQHPSLTGACPARSQSLWPQQLKHATLVTLLTLVSTPEHLYPTQGLPGLTWAYLSYSVLSRWSRVWMLSCRKTHSCLHIDCKFPTNAFL